MKNPVVKESLTTEDPIVLSALETGEMCTVCGSTIDKSAPGHPRICADSETAPIWQDGEFACPTIKRMNPTLAPYLRRKRLANLFGRIESISRATREALEDEGRAPGLLNQVELLENLIRFARKKTNHPQGRLIKTDPTKEGSES